jgi:hypothetical protein
MRYGYILPWDGDADISFLFNHDKFLLHEDLMELHGIQSNGLMAHFKTVSIDYIRWRERKGFYNGMEETLLIKHYPSFVLENENILVKYHHKLESFPLSWVVPTKTMNLNGVNLRIPNAPHKLLRHRYPWTYSTGLSVPYKWKCWVPCWIRTANGC